MSWFALRTVRKYSNAVAREREAAADSNAFLDNLREERLRTPEGREQERLRDLEKPDKMMKDAALTTAAVGALAAISGVTAVSVINGPPNKHLDHPPPNPRSSPGSRAGRNGLAHTFGKGTGGTNRSDRCRKKQNNTY
jgi:hypothetical protein